MGYSIVVLNVIALITDVGNAIISSSVIVDEKYIEKTLSELVKNPFQSISLATFFSIKI